MDVDPADLLDAYLAWAKENDDAGTDVPAATAAGDDLRERTRDEDAGGGAGGGAGAANGSLREVTA
jgi:hypothetical protein